jgi:hypothetical protein
VDFLFNFGPAFTLTVTVIGSLATYLIMSKYLKHSSRKQTSKPEKSSKGPLQSKGWPVIDPATEDVVKAIRTYSENLPKGVYRTILVKEDNQIDFQQIAPILGGIPAKPFYMSKETYEVFPEHEKDIPPIMDIVQRAVDLYVKDHKHYPMLPYDPFRRVNYYQLLQGHYLDFMPEIELYITHYDGLVSHIKPSKKLAKE